jgi:hypothetical protein
VSRLCRICRRQCVGIKICVGGNCTHLDQKHPSGSGSHNIPYAKRLIYLPSYGRVIDGENTFVTHRQRSIVKLLFIREMISEHQNQFDN